MWSSPGAEYSSSSPRSRTRCRLPASSSWGDDRLEFASPAFGCLDYGRGVWPEYTVWNWGSASGVQDGRSVGLNLGGQWTDGTGMTENGVCIDGRLTKISEDMIFDYDRAIMMKPWRVRTTATDRIDLLFEPEFERISESGRRDGYFTSAHQMFGRYSGRITPDEGGPVDVRDLFGARSVLVSLARPTASLARARSCRRGVEA